MPEKQKTSSTHTVPSTDPASGKFIIADILPPQKTDVRPTVQRTALPKEKPISRPPAAPLRSVAARGKIGSEQALDAWFRKEQNHSEQKQASPSAQFPLSRKKKYATLGVCLLLLLLIGGYGVSYALSYIDVHIKLKTTTHQFNEKLSIAEKTSDENILAGERLDLSDSATASFKASGSDDVRAKAKGVVSIYNAFNTSPQTLVANTRFEAPDGAMYRIREAVVIPAAVIENGALSPRSVDATIYADQPGPDYNRGVIDFTIPGFKGSPRYKGFYARSKTLIDGGHIGTATIVTQSDIDTARDALESQLRSQMIAKLKALVPEGFILLEDAIEITAGDREFSVEVGDVADEFSGTITFHARVLVFPHEELISALAAKAGFESSAVSLDNPDTILLAVERRNMENGTLILSATGDALFVWNLNTDELASRMAETRDPGSFASIFQNYPAIDRAEVRFKPSWIQKLPRSSADIKIHMSH